MIRLRTTRAAFAVATIGAIALAGCGSSSSSTSSTTASTTTPSSTTSSSPAPAGGAAAVGTADNSDLGQTILVGANGMTLYNFEKDESDESYCNGECAKAWPPLTTNGAPKSSGDASQSQLGTIKRDDGSMQVTYDGHPLYYFEGDKKPGEATGNGSEAFGAEWYALQPSGENAEGKGGDEDSGSS